MRFFRNRNKIETVLLRLRRGGRCRAADLRSRSDRRRRERLRHRARCRRAAASASSCASRAISPAPRPRPRPSSSMAACAISSIYEFRLVREALIEREVLLAAAPHIIWPLRFVLPHHQRPAALAGAPARPLPLRPSRRPRTSCRRPAALDLTRGRGRASRSSRIFAAPSNIPTAGSTMRASSCSTPVDAADRGADIRTRTTLRRGAARGRRLAPDARGQRDRARASRSRRGRWSTPPAPGCRDVLRQVVGLERAGRDPPGQGQPHRRRPALRPRPRLHLPECRRAHLLRHPL